MVFKTRLIGHKILPIAIFLILYSTSCATQLDPTPEPSPTYQPLPTPTRPAQLEYLNLWKQSQHAQPLLFSGATTSECAFCHSPLNVPPGSTFDPPLTCTSCKQPASTTGTQVPIDPNESFTGRSNVSCASCHEVKDGFASSEIAWLNPLSGAHEPVGSARELCLKCHLDQTQLAADLSAPIAHQALQCTDCHDAHSSASSCANEACHPNLAAELKLIQEHTPPASHAQVKPGQCSECHPDRADIIWPAGSPHMGQQHITLRCPVCHDAAGLKVDVLPDGMHWTTFFKLSLGEKTLEIPTFSHQIQRTVSCERCHYPGNPWDLLENVPPNALKR